MEKLLIRLEGMATRRVFSNEASQAPALRELLGEGVYNELLAIDPQPTVVDVLAIATGPNGPLSFKPKYDLEISREKWNELANSWIGKPLTSKHSPDYGDTDYPETLARVLKQAMQPDGWHVYAYVLPSQAGYKSDLRAEASLFKGQNVRPVSTEFFVQRVENTITLMEPVLIAEVFSPNVAGSGVRQVLNKKSETSQRLELNKGGSMERTELIALLNGLSPKDLEGTNVLKLVQNEYRAALVSDKDFRKEIVNALSAEEREGIVNAATEELLAKCANTLTAAQKILNKREEDAKKANKDFRETVQRMYKDVTTEELPEEKAAAVINAMEFKPGMENQVKKYFEHMHNIKNGQQSALQQVVAGQQKAQTAPPVKNAQAPAQSGASFVADNYGPTKKG